MTHKHTQKLCRAQSIVAVGLHRMAEDIGCMVFYDQSYYLVGDGVILCESENADHIADIIENIRANVHLAKVQWQEFEWQKFAS